MTSYNYDVVWFTRDGVSNTINGLGQSVLTVFMRDDVTGFTYDQPFGGVGNLWAVSSFSDGVQGVILDGTSNTISLSEVTVQATQFAFGDGSVRFISDALEIEDPTSGRTYLMQLDGTPLPFFEEATPTIPRITDVDGAVSFINETLDWRAPILYGDAAPGNSLDLVTRPNLKSITENDRAVLDGTSNTILFGEGNDHGWGRAGNDVLYGGTGSDRLYGEIGNDSLYGGAGDDSLYGGVGRDTILGGSYSDLIYGGDGADDLYGESGRDRLFGGRGADILDGGAGDDKLTGGGGADAFIFTAGGGADLIKDFNAEDGDILRLDSAMLGSATTGAEVSAMFGAALHGHLGLVLATGETIEFTNLMFVQANLDLIATAIEIF